MKTSRGLVGYFATVGLLLGLTLRAAVPPQPTPLPPVASLAELQAKIEEHVTQPKFAGAAWGVKIVSLDTGRTLYEHAANRRLSPASNSKLYTGAFALDQLGADYRMRTPILASVAVDGAGELKGNLIVSGRGDPSWDPRRLKQDFMTVLAPFVAVVKKAGVRRIAGDVVADATYFRSTPQGGGWTADDMNDYYGAEISAITFDDNYVDLRVVPGAAVGAPCVIEMAQLYSGLTLENRTRTVGAGGARSISVLRVPGETTVQVFGELPLGGKEELTEATVPRPARWFAAGLKAALERAGIAVGGARGVRWPEASPTAAGDVKLGEVVSTPLREFLPVMMKQSQNLQADLIFAHLGESRRVPTTPAWTRTEDLAVAGLKEFLGRHALRPEDVIFDEGSGLSRNNLTTAAATVALLQFMATHRDAAVFADSLPVAGVDGTLRRRMKGTPAEGKIHAKTGTLRWATALSGYVNSTSGERLAFSLMLNRYQAAPKRAASQELDEIAALLARYSGPK
ncbi:MAG: D-alanyl-D-alanine carboxypeptidase/D-alanyl-D-alanine-endopeptidase [Undibacterium sp.]|nr:D-alanyl-D-alanine carboxypeptidase/D-alanyl-D-alanine-endopeptidase [Opitutaceae bacterium]